MKSSDNPIQRYLGLSGIIMRSDYEQGRFTEALNLIKRKIFGTEAIVFHRREMMHAEPPFQALNDAALRSDLDVALLELMTSAAYKVVTVVIDKKAHKEKYRVWQFDPYHYCMTCLLERYVSFLKAANEGGDVLAESRERRDNKRLSNAYIYVRKHGTRSVSAADFQRFLPAEIKIQRKKENVAGLQLADLIANPSSRDVICRNTRQLMTAGFGGKVAEILNRKKYRRSPFNGSVAGWGTKWLP
jgi:hypothetical protein